MALVTSSVRQHLVRDPEITGWYSNSIPSSAEAILQEAFHRAKTLFAKELSSDERKKIWTEEETTMRDVERAVEVARIAYEAKPKSKARMWLAVVSEKIVYYGNIMDVLVQHHPEYVSLAWGAFKFTFVAILNHEELIKNIAKSLSRIADILPQQRLILVLYPTPQMQEAVARLYARILGFIQHAICWFKQGKALHVLGSVFKPWALSFQDHFESISTEAQRVKEFGNLAAKAEQRDMHIEVLEARMDWQDAKNEILKLRVENKTLVDLMETRFEHLDRVVLSLHKEIRLDLRGQNETLSQIHLNQLLSLSFWQHLPTSGESLEYCKSMRHRRRDRVKLLLPDLSTLEHWAAEPKSSLLVTHSASPAISKTFMIDLLNLIRGANLPILWALRYANYWESTMTCIDILRILVLQALQMKPEALLDDSHPIRLSQMREASSASDWLCILDRALAGMPRVFIVLDTDLLAHVTDHDRQQASELVESLRSNLSGAVKVFAAASSILETYIRERLDSNDCIRLHTDGGTGRDARRRKSNARKNWSRRYVGPASRVEAAGVEVPEWASQGS